jgi:pyocin large subunit-like protein
MAGVKAALSLALGISAAALLAGCDNGPSAVRGQAADAARTAPAADGGSRSGYARRDGGGDRSVDAGVDHRKDEVRLVEGKPMWSASRRYSAEANAQRAYERNGQAFGARSEDEFIRQAHDFVDHPPAGTQTLTRANGDTLFYDPKGNVFAVAGKDGAPRTMFKPDDGAAYWRKQKDRESQRQSAGRSRTGRDDEA